MLTENKKETDVPYSTETKRLNELIRLSQGYHIIDSKNASVPKNKMCRICYETENNGELVDPCKCSGSSKYVHQGCLLRWIETTTNPEAKKKCLTCRKKYVYEQKQEISHHKCHACCAFFV